MEEEEEASDNNQDANQEKTDLANDEGQEVDLSKMKWFKTKAITFMKTSLNLLMFYIREFIDKITVISVSRKDTGCLYINGKTHHVSWIDFVLSILLYAIVISAISRMISRLGVISG